VRAGDRVALFLPSGTRFVELVHAVTWCGAAVLPLNTRLTTSEIEFQLDDARPFLVIHDSKPPLADVAREAAQGAGLESVTSVLELEEIGRSLNAPGDLPSVDPRAAAAIVYTSGTTGHPKGAYLTFRNLIWSAMASVTRLQTQADDRWLACMPLFHVGGLSILIRAAVSGSTVVLHDRFDETALDHAIEERGITGVSFVPAMLDRWLNHRRGRHTPRSLRVALVGGGPLSGSLHRKGIASGCPVVPTYGLTEAASQVATLSPAEIGHHPSTVGRALPGTRLRIAAEDGRPLPADREGEIQVAAPTVMAGYLNRPEETQRVLADGWLRTGDVGLLTEEGYLRVLDRRTDLIVSGGENVYPREVEEALAAHPGVLDVAVIGVDDRRFGKRPAAWVSLRPGHRAETAELTRPTP
jgi:O-succinylbenzoic acid--CoA ligase